MELFCRICPDMIDDKDTNMYKSVLYGSRQFLFLHNASICHNQLYYCFWCIHICLLRVLDWWIYIFQILENFSISIERFPSLCNSNLQIPNEKIVHLLLYRILELWNITLHKGWLGTCIGEQPKLWGGGIFLRWFILHDLQQIIKDANPCSRSLI